MLNDGIYEQIINTKIAGELSSLQDGQFDIGTMPLNAGDARHYLTIYLSHVIERGLRFIRDSYLSSEDAEALKAQIDLCNDIVNEVALHVNEAAKDGQPPEYEDYHIIEEGKILSYIYSRLNSLISGDIKNIIRPETSITENALFTGSQNEPSMLSELKKEIASADEIKLLVSFIKWSGIRPLMPELIKFTGRKDFENKSNSPKLRIIATTYMQATDIKAIVELAKLPNTEIKINYETNHARLHAKSYLFKRKTNFSTAYIGSSNISNPALTGGLEWNVKVTEQESWDILKKFDVSFESYWNDPSFVTYDPNDGKSYERLFDELNKNQDDTHNNFHLQLNMHPYAYQQEILDKLEAERKVYGHYKNLIVAATGVGKTIIAAFDYKKYHDENEHSRLLFVAHRKEILEQSLEKFREVLNDFNFGDYYADGHKPANRNHLFISIQSFNSSKLYEETTSDYYDYVVVDEFHHAAAPSYQKLLNYYHPKILLGLTATPDRMDGNDIYHYFDGHIAASLLLSDAISQNLLSTFQYFGVTDQVDYSKVKWTNGKYDVSDLENAYIVTAGKTRANLILSSVERYTTDINDVKGLGFCVSVKHAQYMAEYFNQNNVPSISLSAESNDDERNSAKEKLESGQIKFIFVVDLYNEGVDIPCVNTILFLRPTDSATVFLQQLGRGLRLCEGKECLTVLDFIGQANKKYRYEMKFRALTGNSKKSIRKQVEEGFSNLPRGCYIELEKVAKGYVLDNLKQFTGQKADLIERVKNFKDDTGKELTMSNFLDEYGMTLYDLYSSDGSRSWYRLKKWAGLEFDAGEADNTIYRAFSGLFHIKSSKLIDFWIKYIEEDYYPQNQEEILMRNMLYYTFYGKIPSKVKDAVFADLDDGIHFFLKDKFVKEEVLEILNYNRAHLDFIPIINEYDYTCPLEIYCAYNRNQIMAAYGLFNENESPEFREGVKYFKEKKTDIFLINLNKSDKDFSPSTMYEDYAKSATLFHWESQSQDRPESAKIQRYIHHKETGNTISLFVREYKNNGQYTAPYIFLGNADYVSSEGSEPVGFDWRLHYPIPATLLPKANKAIAV